jgi:DNA invertase Pin-like site-specific DNA recombinase
MRLVAYVRVSRVGSRDGESFISPDVQRERIDAFAAAHGHTITAYETDLDKSGGTMRRPAFERAMRAIESGKADGLIVAKLDRFARTLDGALGAVRRLDAAGAVLVSVSDNLDASTPTGKAMFRMLLVIAELQRDMIAAEWQSARAEAIGKGKHIASLPPRGYVRVDGRLQLDPERGPLVLSVFEARAAGAQLAECGRMLGISTQGARNLLKNRAYIGEARHGEHVNATAHEPLVSRELFERVQHARGVAVGRSGEGRLLSGLIRCATCRHTMSGSAASGRYKCSNDHCAAPAVIMSDRVEHAVRGLYAMFIEAPAIVAAKETAGLKAELEAAEAELAAYVQVMRATDPGYRTGYDQRVAVANECRRALAQVEAPELHVIDDDEPVREQRRKLAGAIYAVFVRRGRGDVHERLKVVYQGSRDIPELPTRGNRARVLPSIAI